MVAICLMSKIDPDQTVLQDLADLADAVRDRKTSIPEALSRAFIAGLNAAVRAQRERDAGIE